MENPTLEARMVRIEPVENFAEDYVLGSGFLGYYSWHGGFSRSDYGYLFTLEDPYNDGWKHYELKPQQLWDAFIDLVNEGAPCVSGLDVRDPDIDAGIADCILQKAAYGEIVYA